MTKIISYRMNSAWRTNDKLFMFPHEARQLGSTVCAGLRRLLLFSRPAVYRSPLISWVGCVVSIGQEPSILLDAPSASQTQSGRSSPVQDGQGREPSKNHIFWIIPNYRSDENSAEIKPLTPGEAEDYDSLKKETMQRTEMRTDKKLTNFRAGAGSVFKLATSVECHWELCESCAAGASPYSFCSHFRSDR